MNDCSDFLIIGSGIAGLSFALYAAEHGSVTIVTKKQRADTNTNHAQGGIAAVFGSDDSFEQHITDTLTAGVGLCHRDAVELIVREAPSKIRELIRWGVHFTFQDKEHFDLGREGGHSRNRIIHAKDHTGRAMEQALLDQVRHHHNIRVFENYTAIEFITEHHLSGSSGTGLRSLNCYGIYALDGKTNRVEIFPARMTLLSSGGAGQVYCHTTNPDIATGDGMAMAFRAGACIANMEFMQFHPTTLWHPDGDSFLISEAVRGHGGILRTRDGQPFMKQVHPQADLAPRDVVARAIDRELKIRGDDCVFLDVTHIPAGELMDRFPHIYERLISLKIDMTREPIPVVPAAHYMCGGVWTDLVGQTTIRRLFATGESACTGVHGANRLASNSLLEALVFSYEAVQKAIHNLKIEKITVPEIPQWDDRGTYDHEEWVLIAHDQKEVQRLMWDYVGIVRSNQRMIRAQRRIELIAEEVEAFYKKTRVTGPLLELRNICCTALLVIRSALFRKESRGLHYNTDYPDIIDPDFLGDTMIQSGRTWIQPLQSSQNRKKGQKKGA
ncbi:L-aspartate oxidase [bacterium]|nr:L-aspartate oxidase [bacterium]